MRTQAVSAGFYHSDVWQKDYPKIQLRTIRELLDGKEFELPPHPSVYQADERVRRPQGLAGKNGRGCVVRGRSDYAVDGLSTESSMVSSSRSGHSLRSLCSARNLVPLPGIIVIRASLCLDISVTTVAL